MMMMMMMMMTMVDFDDYKYGDIFVMMIMKYNEDQIDYNDR